MKKPTISNSTAGKVACAACLACAFCFPWTLAVAVSGATLVD